MYPISNDVRALFEAEQKKVLRITGTDKNGNSILITDANVMEGGFSIDRYCCNGTRLEIGTAVSAELTLTLDNRQGQFNSITFEGAELFVEIGIADWSPNLEGMTTDDDDNIVTDTGNALCFSTLPTTSWIPCGVFIPDEQPRRLATITLHALDRMMKFSVKAEGLTLPATIQSVISQICTLCNVTLASDITTLTGYDYTIQALPDGDVSMRDVLRWCAGLLGTNAYMDWNGELRLDWYNGVTNHVITTANRYDGDVDENPIQITGVQYVSDDDTVYIAGTDTYVIDVSDNPFVNADNASTILNIIYAHVAGYAYYPFTASVVACPYLYPMDRLVYQDANGNGHATLLTNVNFVLNGSTELAAIGESNQTNLSMPPSSFTSQQTAELLRIGVSPASMQQAIDHATDVITGALGGHARIIEDANGEPAEFVILDTTDINTAVNVWRWNSGGFGHSSSGYGGPYSLAMTMDGQIVASLITTGVLNAGLITAGVMSCDRLQGGTLTLGGSADTNGVLTIKDANGNDVITGDKDGLTITSGSINLGSGAFSVTSAGVLSCTGANITGEFSNTGSNGSKLDIVDGELSFYAQSTDLTPSALVNFALMTTPTGSPLAYSGLYLEGDDGIQLQSNRAVQIHGLGGITLATSGDIEVWDVNTLGSTFGTGLTTTINGMQFLKGILVGVSSV